MAVKLSYKQSILICLVTLTIYGNSAGAILAFRRAQIGPKPKWNETIADKLKKDLLTNYDRYARPENHFDVTYVRGGLYILSVETNERRSTVTVNSWFRLSWTDSKFKWNGHDYGGLTTVRIGDHEVWHPDIYLYHSDSDVIEVARLGSVNVVVHSSGKVEWVVPVVMNAICNYDLRHWPFDTQLCILALGSWTYSDDEINISFFENNSAAEVADTITASAWNVETLTELDTRKYSCCVETYTNLIIKLFLTRKSSPYYAIIVTPAVGTTILTLLQFWLPPTAGEKIVLNGFAIVLLNIILIYFSNEVVGINSDTPAIVSFYSNSLYISGFITAGAIITFSVSKIQKRQPLPEIIKKFLNHAEKWLFLDQFFKEEPPKSLNRDEKMEEMEDHHLSHNQLENKPENLAVMMDSNRKEWNMFITAIDRICFLIYCFAYIVLAISLFSGI